LAQDGEVLAAVAPPQTGIILTKSNIEPQCKPFSTPQ
jgi:hypothetical protein